MFPKVWTSLAILLAASLEVHGHAAVAPVIGLGSTAPKRSDVKRPSTASPCGAGVNIASALGASTPVQAAADGTFTATVTNFNGGSDGSRQVTAQVDAAAAGTNFVPLTVSKNGDAAPSDVGSQPIVASLPTGTKCTGGTTGNVCLVSFKTTAGFGNCVAVQQGAGGAAATASNSTTTNSTAINNGSSGSAVAGSNSTDTTGTGAGAAGSTTANNGHGKGNGQGEHKHKHAQGASAKGQGNGNNGGAAGAQGGGAGAGAASAAGAQGGVGGADKKADGAASSAGKGNQNLRQFAQGGTRAARALRTDLENLKKRGEEVVEYARSWVWA